MPKRSEAAPILDALGDPIRRAIYNRLSAEGSCATDLARMLPVTRSAVSRHLGVLRRVGLVECEAAGVRSLYRRRRSGLAPLRQWIEALERRDGDIETPR